MHQGRHFNFFLGGPNFFLFSNATGLLKNWKKQHFICSNLTLFIVPFFLFSLFFSFLFFFFFFFSFTLGGGRRPPQPPPLNDASGMHLYVQVFMCLRGIWKNFYSIFWVVLCLSPNNPLHRFCMFVINWSFIFRCRRLLFWLYGIVRLYSVR